MQCTRETLVGKLISHVYEQMGHCKQIGQVEICQTEVVVLLFFCFSVPNLSRTLWCPLIMDKKWGIHNRGWWFLWYWGSEAELIKLIQLVKRYSFLLLLSRLMLIGSVSSRLQLHKCQIKFETKLHLKLSTHFESHISKERKK